MSVAISGSGSVVMAGGGAVSALGEARYLMLFGDSKTENSGTTTWPQPLAATADHQSGRLWYFADGGQGGATVATSLSIIPAALATMPDAAAAPDIRALINLGVNDVNVGLPNQATWIANYQTLLDAIHTKWPSALIYVTRPWARGHDSDCDTLATWIDTIVASRSFARLGDDERVWYRNNDNGVTYSVDGTHYNALGNLAKIAATSGVLW